MVLKYKQVYTGSLVATGIVPPSADPHNQLNGVDLWTPQGDVVIIGAKLSVQINPAPNTSLGDLGGVYLYAEISTIARNNEARALILHCLAAIDPVELPTLGEHGLWGSSERDRFESVMFPEGHGIDMDRWHPVYLNIGYRAFYAGGSFELGATGIIYYIER